MKIGLYCFGFKTINEDQALKYFIQTSKLDYDLLEKKLIEEHGKCNVTFKSFLENKVYLSLPTIIFIKDIPVAEFNAIVLPDEIDIKNENVKDKIHNNVLNSRYLYLFSIKNNVKHNFFLIDFNIDDCEKYFGEFEYGTVDLQSILTSEEIKNLQLK